MVDLKFGSKLYSDTRLEFLPDKNGRILSALTWFQQAQRKAKFTVLYVFYSPQSCVILKHLISTYIWSASPNQLKPETLYNGQLKVLPKARLPNLTDYSL